MCVLTNTERAPLCTKSQIQQKPLESSRAVRFYESVAVHQENIPDTAFGMSQWLSPIDFSIIREDIIVALGNLDRNKEQNDCARGLEDYATELRRRGSLRKRVVRRRKRAIRAVLNQQNFLWSLPSADRDEMIRKVYQQETYSNALHAVHVGRVDSEEALAVYREDPPQGCTTITTTPFTIQQTLKKSASFSRKSRLERKLSKKWIFHIGNSCRSSKSVQPIG